MTQKKKNCKGCKHICTQCSNHFTDGDAGNHLCYAFEEKVQNCVTGNTEAIYAKCEEINKDGCCTEFKQDPRKLQTGKLKKLLKELHKEDCGRYHNCNGGDDWLDVTIHIIEAAITILEAESIVEPVKKEKQDYILNVGYHYDYDY